MPLTMKFPKARLAHCRENIDDLDRRLVALLNERTAIVEQIGQAKKEAQMPVYEPKREEASTRISPPATTAR